jgi:hypothetical protein
MANAAMDKALDLISEVFRPERKANEEILLQGHRVQELVENGRYDFRDACIAMKVTADEVRAAYNWLMDDDARLLTRFDYEGPSFRALNLMMVAWMDGEEEGADPVIVELRRRRA